MNLKMIVCKKGFYNLFMYKTYVLGKYDWIFVLDSNYVILQMLKFHKVLFKLEMIQTENKKNQMFTNKTTSFT